MEFTIPTIPSLPSLPKMPTFPAMASLPQVTIPDIATGAFVGGPDDAVASIDIYKIKSAVGGAAKALTSIQEINLTPPKDVLDGLMDGKPAIDFLSKLEGNLIPPFNAKDLTARIAGPMDEFKSAFGELNAAMKKGSLINAYKQQASKISVTFGEYTGLVNTAKMSDVKSLGNFVNKYTGTKVFSGKDGGALSGLLGYAITASSNLGIPGAFKTLTATMNDNGILGRITRTVLPIAMKNSDSKMLREITNSPAAGLINVLSPGFTRDFTKAFTYRGNTGGRQLGAFEDVFHSFEKMDNQWDQLKRGGSDNAALNLLSMASGSRDFQNLVMTGVKFWETEKRNGKTAPVKIDPMYALATAFRETTVGQAIKRDFPKVALLSVYNAKMPKKNGGSAGMRSARKGGAVDARVIKGSLGALFGW